MKFPINHCAALLVLPAICQAAQIEVTATNPLEIPRADQTIEISAKDLASLGAKNLNLIHARDSSGKELVVQAIDLDGDEMRAFDAVLFQSDFAPGETKNFTLGVGVKQVYAKDQYKAFGRFARERFDDFAWENDRIAHRTYGEALQTWKGEPLTSSTIDIWSKRTPRMIINDWYLTDDYHVDHGDGADFYSAGVTRGCGGCGVWLQEKLWVSPNFRKSNVLANGPIRVLFELDYPPYQAGGKEVTETKRISLDAGSQFDRIESRFAIGTSGNEVQPLTIGIGLKKVAGEKVEENAGEGWILKWEKMEKNAGNQGLAIITSPQDFSSRTEDDKNLLVLTQPGPSNAATYWAGFCWDKAGRLPDMAEWRKHVSGFARGVAAPIEVKVTSIP